jgi:hypothetical protein
LLECVIFASARSEFLRRKNVVFSFAALAIDSRPVCWEIVSTGRRILETVKGMCGPRV